MTVSLFNKDIAGWRVQAVEPLYFHIPDPSNTERFRHVQVPEGTPGTLTGEIGIFYADSDEGSCQALARDSGRLKKLLEHPEGFASLRKTLNYWGAAHKLKGEERLASSILLNVAWDSVPKNESGKAKFFSYIPWLKFVAAR
jgi:hypothetical protein